MINESPAQKDERFMRCAIEEALAAAREGEVPVGAVIVAGGRIIARTHNMTERLKDVCAHAEILAITAASEHLGGKYLPDCTLYVTLEPCMMCAGALGWSQIGRIVYGASDPRRGFTAFCSDSRKVLHPKTIVDKDVCVDKCRDLIVDFFKNRR